MAVDGLGNALTYDGASWSEATPVGPRYTPLTSVTCVSAAFCAALDETGRVTTYDGQDWSKAKKPQRTITVTAISCVSRSFCVAGGYTASATPRAAVWDGQTWGRRARLPEAPTALSCATQRFCAAVDGDRGAFTFNGTSWSDRQDLGSGQFLSVSCPTATFCAAGTSNGRVQTYGGTEWSKAAILGGKGVALDPISCASESFCVVTDESGRYSVYDGGGWDPLIRFTQPVLSGISCPSATFCLAVRQQSDYLTFDRSAWTPHDQLEPGNPNGLQSVSCATQTFCAAVDDGGSAFTYDGSDWSEPVRGLASSLLTVQCSSPTFCLALAEDGGRTSLYDGSRWTRGPDLPGDANFPSVSCASAQFCLAVEHDGAVYRFDGAAWSMAPAIEPDEHQLSCGSSTFCVVGSAYHGVSIWNGSEFVPDHTFPLGRLAGVSCTPAHFCMASGTNGWSTYDGSSWSAPVPVYPFDRISCPSAKFCASVNELAQARTYRNGTWSEPKDLGVGHRGIQPSAQVSCTSASFCMAVTFTGYAIAYRQGA